MRRFIRILMVILAILVILVLIILFLTNNPMNIIERKFDFTIPESSTIINHTYNRFTGEFEAKILLDEADINTIRSNLSSYFKNEFPGEFERLSSYIKKKGWDIDINSIITAYIGAELGPGLFIADMSVGKAAVLAKQNNSEYCLYIFFVISPIDVIF